MPQSPPSSLVFADRPIVAAATAPGVATTVFAGLLDQLTAHPSHVTGKPTIAASSGHAKAMDSNEPAESAAKSIVAAMADEPAAPPPAKASMARVVQSQPAGMVDRTARPAMRSKVPDTPVPSSSTDTQAAVPVPVATTPFSQTAPMTPTLPVSDALSADSSPASRPIGTKVGHGAETSDSLARAEAAPVSARADVPAKFSSAGPDPMTTTASGVAPAVMLAASPTIVSSPAVMRIEAVPQQDSQPIAQRSPAAQVAAAFIGLGPAGTQSTILRLHPAELGQVQISIVHQATGGVSVALVAERPETLLLLLLRDQTALHHALDQAGMPTQSRIVTFDLAPADVAAPTGQAGTGFTDGQPNGGTPDQFAAQLGSNTGGDPGRQQPAWWPAGQGGPDATASFTPNDIPTQLAAITAGIDITA